MSLKHVAAMMLCHYAGTPISVDAIRKVLGAIGGDLDETVAQKLVSAVEGKDMNEVINSGLSQLSAVPAGGAAPAVGAGTSAVVADDAPKAEEKKEEPEEEEDDDMGFGLFD